MTASLEVPDPLDPDQEDDEPVLVSRRHLARLALVSSEVTARFMRDGLDVDPIAWMFSPQPLFDGRAAIDAALDLDCCSRAIVVHGLGLGLDADAGEIDRLHDVEEAPGGRAVD